MLARSFHAPPLDVYSLYVKFFFYKIVFSCSLIGIAYTILFSMFPYIAKWVLLIFALNLLPSIVNNAKKNTKPLWLLGKILSEGGTYAYLVLKYLHYSNICLGTNTTFMD